MGILDSILRALVSCICGPEDGKRPTEPEDVYVPPVQHIPQQHPQYPPQQPHAPQPHKPQSPPRQHTPGPRVDQNQVNQQNEHYTSLRARANEEGDKMAQCFERSHDAYQGGDGALAKELSNEGKAHQREMDRLNREASEWIYVENNKDSKPGEIDLHGLYVKEAISYADRAIQEARQRGDAEVHFIVGKGLHSKNGMAKLKPAIEELMQKNQLVAELNPNNGGVLVVSLDGRERGAGRVMHPDDIARGIESKEDGCIIM
ncbi:unnamed protein product [Somion occarium]|uniref:Smr domain-containing protein n=1 Tax=Somion occarium TaxID=3059160 RepID=A0ABP1DKD7_9APHY